MGVVLPGICDKQGGEAAAGPGSLLQTLNFPTAHYNQGGSRKQAQWQMQAHGEGLLRSTEDPPKLLSHMCSFLWPALCDKTWNCWLLESEVGRQGCLSHGL